MRGGIALKLSGLTLAGTAAVLGLLVGYNYYAARHSIRRNAEANARNLALATVNQVDSALRAAEQVPRTLAAALEGPAVSTADIDRWLGRALSDNQDLYGLTVAYDPYGFDPNREMFARYAQRQDGAIVVRPLGGADYRYFTMDWYQIPRETGHAQWTEPYFDQGGGEIVMSTYGVPFYHDIAGQRRFAGVVTADISLRWLQAMVASVRVLDSGFAFLISKNGTFVTHPTSRLVMNETIFSLAEELHDDHLRAVGRNMIRGDTGFVTVASLLGGPSAWLEYAPVPANGWSLGALFPSDELFADINGLSRRMLLFGAGGSLALVLIVVGVARSMTGPLTALAQASDAIAGGDLDSAVPTVKSHDEIGRLARAFAGMQKDLRRYVADLQRTTAEKEAAAEQLAEYSRTLEQKVDARTQELRTKNDELGTTLERLQQTQAQLVAQEKLASLGQLTAGVAHEIKNPLNFVTNFAQLSSELLQELRDELTPYLASADAAGRQAIDAVLADLETNVAKINEHGKRADGIVQGMLQHSRSGGGTPEPTNLNALVADAVQLATQGWLLQDAHFKLRIDAAYDAQVSDVEVVPQDLSRVILNLVANACYAMHAKQQRGVAGYVPILSVCTRDLGDRVEVRVRDNGDGVPGELREKIFHPFFTTKPPGKGAGLGLSICNDIVVQEHQGELRVESEAGVFAEFVVVLPRLAG